MEGGPLVAVFGGSEPRPGDPVYDDALETARFLGSHGFSVVTGGYGGVMEAACRGANEAGARSVGVTCAAFDGEEPNRWLSERVEEEDLFTRTRRLLELAEGFLVFAGRSGTLAEVAFIWALHRARHAPPRPVALAGEGWGRILDLLTAEGFLEERVRAETTFHPDGPSAARWLADRLAGGAGADA
jgi:uncharacterized protein (TIGR00730 family)